MINWECSLWQPTTKNNLWDRSSSEDGWVAFLTFLVCLWYCCIIPDKLAHQTCTVSSVFFFFFLHPLGATEEAPCQNTFVHSSRKLEARRLHQQGQSNKSRIDKHPTDAPCDIAFRLHVKSSESCRSVTSTCATLETSSYLHADVSGRNISAVDLTRDKGWGGSYCPDHVGRKIQPEILRMPKGTRYSLIPALQLI